MLAHRRRNLALAALTVGALASGAVAPPARAQAHDHPAAGGPADLSRLGAVSFPNSGAPAAQAPFLRGMALLHSFLYAEARTAFQEALRIDPGFAMAYWGELMATQDLDSAQVEPTMRRFGATPAARLARAPTPRERDYVAVLEQYALRLARTTGPDSATGVDYADAMRGLHERYPDDDDATLFYVLALLGRRYTEQARPEQALRTAVEAAALGEDVFRRKPTHPGAAHYLIHVYDEARLYPLGLRAARVYAGIAPGASHALHMPSHIFFRYGLWDEVVGANEQAWRASHATVAGAAKSPAAYDWHAFDWLQYAYLQQGRLRLGRAMADTARALLTPDHVAALPPGMRAFVGRMPALLAMRYAAETGEWTLPPGTELVLRAAGLRALAARDASALDSLARVAVRGADSIRTAGAGAPPGLLWFAARAAVDLRAFRAELAGQTDSAVALLRQSADLEEGNPAAVFQEGPRTFGPTSSELLGGVLLAAARPAAALAAYDRALVYAPGHAAALLGRARALVALGRTADAQVAYARLLENWARADPDLPGLTEAQAGARRTAAAERPR